MNALDKLIAWVSPQAGVKRARARAAINLVGKLRAYEGATVGRRTEGWSAGAGSANAEVDSAGSRLRTRSRDLVRNDPYARRAIAALVANAVGTGITADSTSPAGKIWKQWINECDYYGELDFYGLQALAARCTFESGECIIVRQRMTSAEAAASRSGVPLKIKVLEPDYLDSTKTGPQSNGNICFSGIEVDKNGRRVGYWLWMQHPGDQPVFQPSMHSVFVRADDVIHLYEKDRPGQLRGVPRLSSVILQLRDLNEYNEAILIKKKVEACFAAFVTTDEDNRTVAPNTATSSEESVDGTSYSQRNETLAPGMIEYLKPGEMVEFGNPSSTAGSDEFEAGRLRGAAMGVGLTYEIMTGDLSRVNYSSMRAGRMEFKTMIEQFRWLVFIPGFCARVQNWFEEAAYMAGRVRSTGYDFTWTPPRWEYVNPKDDVSTDQAELESCLTSWSEQIRKRGQDPALVRAEIAADAAAFKAAGIDIDFSQKKTPAAPPPAPVDNDDDGTESADNADGGAKPKKARSLSIDDLRRELAHMQGQISEARGDHSVTVNTPPPDVRIEHLDLAPIVNVPPANVTVTAPDVRVEMPAPPRVLRAEYDRDPETQEIIATRYIYESNGAPS